MTWLHLAAAGACLAISRYWIPAVAFAAVFALLALSAHETRHVRAAERRRRKVKGRMLNGR